MWLPSRVASAAMGHRCWGLNALLIDVCIKYWWHTILAAQTLNWVYISTYTLTSNTPEVGFFFFFLFFEGNFQLSLDYKNNKYHNFFPSSLISIFIDGIILPLLSHSNLFYSTLIHNIFSFFFLSLSFLSSSLDQLCLFLLLLFKGGHETLIFYSMYTFIVGESTKNRMKLSGHLTKMKLGRYDQNKIIHVVHKLCGHIARVEFCFGYLSSNTTPLS